MGTLTAASIITVIIVVIILLVLMGLGYAKGFLRIALTTGSLVVIIAIAAIFTKPLTNLLDDSSLGNYIETRVGGFVSSRMSGSEDSVIESLPLPSFLQESIKNSNNAAEYAELGVSSFQGYVSAKLSGIVIGVIAYLILMVLASVLISIVVRVAGFVNKIPIIGGVNKLLGALLGLLTGLVVMWVVAVAFMALSGTDFGARVVGVIHESRFLTFIYENNLLVYIAGRFL